MRRNYCRDGLVLDGELVSKRVALAAGQNLLRGTVLGKVTATGKYVLSAADAVDGSQIPDVVLAEDTDATAGDRSTVGYVNATLNEAKLILGPGQTLEAIKECLRVKRLRLSSLVGGR